MRVLCTALALLAAPASAQEGAKFLSDDGDEYVMALNPHGAVLTSIHPKACAHCEPSEDHRIDRKHAIISFGKDCDALHNALGKGRWLQANGEVFAEFERGDVGFVRQELVIPSADCTYLPNGGESWPGNQPDPKPGDHQMGSSQP